MTATDRAFRALARAEPDVVVGLLGALALRDFPADAAVVPEDVDDSRLDPLPPPIDADWVARVGADRVEHVELQGYRDDGFADRVVRYHLTLVLRDPGRRVRTTAVWLLPCREARRTVIRFGDVAVRIRARVLRAVSAEALLADRRTACFAAGADPGGRTPEELCSLVVEALARGGATWRQRQMALIAATVGGLYTTMARAMEAAGMEPVVIEDFVKFGEDRGLEQGLEQGREQGREQGALEGRRAALIVVLTTRGLAVGDAERARVASETSAERLDAWLRRAIVAESVAAVFAE